MLSQNKRQKNNREQCAQSKLKNEKENKRKEKNRAKQTKDKTK